MPEIRRKLINSFGLKVLITLSNKIADFSLDIKKEFAKIYAEESLISALNRSEDEQLVFLDQEGNRYPEFNSNDYGSGMYMDATFIECQVRQDCERGYDKYKIVFLKFPKLSA